ncbi:MAG: hypothetical protein HOP10_11810 [Chitinophagaceae bacterium]|nr:hypothetical protein [Chitinophagaceae bacterium]
MFSVSTTTNNSDCKPPRNRELFHGFIDEQQKIIQKSDGKNDNQYTPSSKEEINFLLTQSLMSRVDALQCKIENDSTLKDQAKIKYLRGLEYQLKFFSSNTKSRKVNPTVLPDIIRTYDECMQNDKQGKSIADIVDRCSYETAYSVVKADNVTFEKNSGLKKSQDAIILKYCILYPDRIFPTLTQYPDVPFADSLVKIAAKRKPKELYDYAQANNKLGLVIRNIKDDSLVKTVVRMARSKDGQQYFCFLDNILHGRMTLDEIDAAKGDSLLYYRLLVKTRMNYVARAQDNDTAIEFTTLQKRMEQKAREEFVNVINALHNESAETRFASIQPLSPEELYYLAVSSDGTIYTSSFVKGVYPLMMKKINNKGDSLLASLRFDKYRKFIKMSAEYNMLGDFLNSFPPATKPGEETDAQKLMRAFTGNLEVGEGLENGVDVADSYASIADMLKPIAVDMLKNVRSNYNRNETTGNKRGMAIYRILEKLFLSADSTTKTDLTKELGVPPIYEVPYQSLVNDSGRVIMQVFFYGDKDGQGIFKGFLGTFSNNNWKITGNDQWVTITSVKGKPVSIYANRPLPEEGGFDEKAQKELGAYLGKNNLQPVVSIHRGHSYTAPYTVEQMSPASKIVFLGSCGGFMILKEALDVSPDAHVIATRQIGDTRVNRPFFSILTEKIRTGNNIEWVSFWKELDKTAKSEDFEDYVPPYKNLGALFIKAYRIAMENEEEQE